MPASIARASRSASATDNPKPSVAFGWPRHCVPEYSDVLVGVIKRCALFNQLLKCRVNDPVLRVRTTGDAQENVRIHQARSNRNLIVFLVEPFARNRLGQWRNLVGELRQGIQPRTYFGRRTRRLGGGLYGGALGKNVFDVCLNAHTSGSSLCCDLVRNFDRDLHSDNLA